MWRTGTPDAKIAPRRRRTSPHRRSKNTNVAESQTKRMSKPPKADMVPDSSPRLTSSAQCNEKKRIESKDVMVNVTLRFI
jgi:hypothetical protein